MLSRMLLGKGVSSPAASAVMASWFCTTSVPHLSTWVSMAVLSIPCVQSCRIASADATCSVLEGEERRENDLFKLLLGHCDHLHKQIGRAHVRLSLMYKRTQMLSLEDHMHLNPAILQHAQDADCTSDSRVHLRMATANTSGVMSRQLC